ncbi:MAG: hypothetical protein ACLU0O_08890 [Collinsella sp.]
MEESFPYDETRDQLEAIADIKADMEAPSPWTACCAATWALARPRLPCARRLSAWTPAPGHGALPTTILAQQHYETFFERFAPFGLEVEVLSASAPRRSKARLRRLPRARSTCSSARTACFLPT